MAGKPVTTKEGMLTLGRIGALIIGVGAWAGCDPLDRLLDVTPPSEVAAEDMTDPANVGFMISGMIGDFQCGLGSLVVLGGTVGYELQDAESFSGRLLEAELRTWAPGGWIANTYAAHSCDLFTHSPLYVRLSRARWQADETLRLLDAWSDAEVPERSDKIATVAAYSGYSRVLLGESMCSVAFDAGPELMPATVFEQAEAAFTRAIQAAQQANNQSTLHFAYAGRARARHNLGRLSDAVSDAAQVPEGFEKYAHYSNTATRRQNRVYVVANIDRRATVGPTYRDMGFEGVPDPRVQVTNSGDPGLNGFTPWWIQQKYESESSPIRLASWVEAQLLIAEAEWQAGNEAVTVDIINRLHDRVGLPHFASTNRAEIWEQLMYERRAELFLEGQHMGDLRRYDWPLIPAPGTLDFQGNVYGDQRCFQLPDIERLNNPNV